MNPDCLIPLLGHGDLVTWVGAGAAAGATWLGLVAVSKCLGKGEAPRLALRDEEVTGHSVEPRALLQRPL